MRNGIIVGGAIGFLLGLVLQSHGLLTGMASYAWGAESDHMVAFSIVLAMFVAAMCGIICAFLGALLEEFFEHQKH